MPFLYKIKYSDGSPDGGYVLTFYDEYSLADGIRLGVQKQLAWCRECNAIAETEAISTVDEIDAMLAELQDPNSEQARFATVIGGVAGSVRELTLRREWRSQRKSPARCLICGHSSFVPLQDDRPIPHPAGHGTITISFDGHCSVRPMISYLFDPEGVRLPGQIDDEIAPIPLPTDDHFNEIVDEALNREDAQFLPPLS